MDYLNYGKQVQQQPKKPQPQGFGNQVQLTKDDFTMIADILEAHYEFTVEMQKNHYLNDDTDYFKQLEYVEELIDKTVYMIGVLSADE